MIERGIKARERRPRGLNNDKVFDTLIYILLTVVLVIVAYPLYFVIIASISDPAKVSSGKVMLYPTGINLEGYMAVFKEPKIVRGFLNSVLYTVVGTSVNLVVTLPAAFSLSRPNFKGKTLLMVFFMIPVFFVGGLVPTFLVVRQMGLYDTMWALILPEALIFYNLVVSRTFFSATIDQALVESAKIEGCSNTRFFFSIALPLSGALVAIMLLYYGVNHWNAYFSSMIYFKTSEKFSLQLILRTLLMKIPTVTEVAGSQEELLRQQQVAELLKYALIIVSSVPVMIVYPFVQKHFVKGVMIGSVKG